MEGSIVGVEDASTVTRRRLRPTVTLVLGLGLAYVAAIIASAIGGERVGLTAIVWIGSAYIGLGVVAIVIAFVRWRRRQPLGESAFGLSLLLLVYWLLPLPMNFLGQLFGLIDAVTLDGLATLVLAFAWAAVSYRAVATYMRDVRENPY